MVPSQEVQRRLGLTDELPATVRAGCRNAAKAFIPVVYCAPLVPLGPAKPNIDDNAMRGRRPGLWTYILDFGSASLSSVNGHAVDANGGHWNFGATTDTWLRSELFLHEPSVRRSIERVRVAGRAAAHAFANRDRVLAIATALIRLQRACGTRHEIRGPCRSVLTTK